MFPLSNVNVIHIRKMTNHVKLVSFLQIHLMAKLMDHKLDLHNIVEFFGWFDKLDLRTLVFEKLDMSINEYCLKNAPVPLSVVRTIVQQV